jgi:hypothetical protein
MIADNGPTRSLSSGCPPGLARRTSPSGRRSWTPWPKATLNGSSTAGLRAHSGQPGSPACLPAVTAWVG